LKGTRSLLAKEGRLLALEQWQTSVDKRIDGLRQTLDRIEKRTRGLPGAIRFLRYWPLVGICGGLLVYIWLRLRGLVTPWGDIPAVVVSVVATVLAGHFYRKEAER